ncbi:MAG: hypothetical protein R3A52_31390 [Polyangiales bacterium]
MTKRAFERREGELVDVYDAPSAGASSMRMDASMLDPREPEPTRAAPSREQIAAWVERLRAGDWSATQEVYFHRGFAGVREALVAACDDALGEEEYITSTLARVGGPGAREALSQRLAQLAATEATFTDAASVTRATKLAELARGALRLDPESKESATALARLFAHPAPHARMFSAWKAAELFIAGPPPSTAAVDALSDALAELVHGSDDDVFVKAFPALWWVARDEAVTRWRALLRAESEWVRHEAVNLALQTRGTIELLPAMVEWLAWEPSLRTALHHAIVLAPVAPPALVRDLTKRSLADASPSLRWEGVGLACALPAEARRELLSAAIADEPDADLRAAMERAALD